MDINGYKGFDKDFKCRGFQFEPGKTYTHDGEAKICQSGFHFCLNPLDVFGYYPPADSRFAEVTGSGKTATHDEDTKVACTKIKIGAEIGLPDIISAGVKFIMERVDIKNAPATNTGYQSAATNTGNWSAATVSGKHSIACGLGVECKARGKKTCWLVLAEREIKNNKWAIKSVQAVEVDGKIIKEDTYYMLKDGEFVEAE